MSDYWNLARPKIVFMVLAAMLASGLIVAETSANAQLDVLKPAACSPWTSIPWPILFHALLGTLGIIVGAVALNQRLECELDSKMRRTADRPLPAERLSSAEVTWFGAIASAVGMAYLIWLGNTPLVTLAILSWLCYVAIYTPLKKRSIWQTPVGAVAGAMPTILGAAAVDEPWNLLTWTLFGMVFLWQFPHSMAIAWLYRREFDEGGIKVATVVDPSGRTAGRFAVFGAAMLLPVSLPPVLYLHSAWLYGLFAGLLGLGYLACSLAFFRRPNDSSARRLLRLSLVYLPLVLIVLTLSTWWIK